MKPQQRAAIVARLELNKAGAAHLEAKVARLKLAIAARQASISRDEGQLAQIDGKPIEARQTGK
jgi:hypothetical protein